MEKGKGRAGDDRSSRTSLPTPASESSSEARGQKRKRVVPQQRATQDNDDEADELDEDEREAAIFTRYFDPNQDPEVRREIKRKSRALEREFQESRDDLLRDSGKGLTRTIHKANRIYRNVKQTNDATLDSRLLVNVSDLAYKKTAQLVIGDNSIGVDVDEFLSKCITYMQNGGPLNRDQEDDAPSSSRRRQPRNRYNDSDDEEDDDIVSEPLDWEFLGRNACFPYNTRPCVPCFLLGPLSVEKKHRTQTQRRARQSKDTAGREARPEALSREDLSRSDENGLTAICKRINTHLRKHVDRAEQALGQAGFRNVEELQSERGRAMLKELRVSDTGGPSLFDYVLNPRSFGQTVENLFYVSFLIKEGKFGIQNDSQGLPTIGAFPPPYSNCNKFKSNSVLTSIKCLHSQAPSPNSAKTTPARTKPFSPSTTRRGGI